jgi:hypothetical protein
MNHNYIEVFPNTVVFNFLEIVKFITPKVVKFALFKALNPQFHHKDKFCED